MRLTKQRREMIPQNHAKSREFESSNRKTVIDPLIQQFPEGPRAD